jgi:hypothetical protein
MERKRFIAFAETRSEFETNNKKKLQQKIAEGKNCTVMLDWRF